MTRTAIEGLGAIFVDPEAYAHPDRWHATATRIREESPVLKVAVEGQPEFGAITKHADVMEPPRSPGHTHLSHRCRQPSPNQSRWAGSRTAMAPMQTRTTHMSTSP
jgi:hypothetical protein